MAPGVTTQTGFTPDQLEITVRSPLANYKAIPAFGCAAGGETISKDKTKSGLIDG